MKKKQGYKHREKKLPIPPATERYCRICESTTKFRYDRIVGHGLCTVCGQGRGIKLDKLSQTLNRLMEYYDDKKKSLDEGMVPKETLSETTQDIKKRKLEIDKITEVIKYVGQRKVSQ